MDEIVPGDGVPAPASQRGRSARQSMAFDQRASTPNATGIATTADWTRLPPSIFQGGVDEVGEPEIPEPLERRSPLWWLIFSCVVLALYFAADGFTIIALPFPQFGSDGDSFIVWGWILHIVGILLYLITLLILLFRKDPFSPFILLGYQFSLVLFFCTAVLHTSRLVSQEPTSSSPFADSKSSAVQLQWVACAAHYILFSVLVYKAPKGRDRLPSAEEVVKHDLYTQIAILVKKNVRKVRAAGLDEQFLENRPMPGHNRGGSSMGMALNSMRAAASSRRESRQQTPESQKAEGVRFDTG